MVWPHPFAGAAGYGMLIYGDAKKQAIRGCFWMAAIGFGGLGVIWGVWEADVTQPLSVRLLVAGTTSAIAGMALTWVLWHLGDQSAGRTQEATAPMSGKPIGNITNNSGIITNNQAGGQNVINQAPPPGIKLLGDPTRASDLKNNIFTTAQLLEIIAPYPPANLQLIAYADGILGIKASAQRTGMQQYGHTVVRPGMAFTNIIRPFGRYLIIIRSSTSAPIKLEYLFQ